MTSSPNSPAPRPVTVTIPVRITVDPAQYLTEYQEALTGTPERYAEEELASLIERLPAHIARIAHMSAGKPMESRMFRLHALETEIALATHALLERVLPAADYLAAVGVVYAAREYDDGWFVVPQASTVFFTDSRPAYAAAFDHTVVDSMDPLDQLLTDYVGGPRGPQSAVAVDLSDPQNTTVEFDATGEAGYRERFRALGQERRA